MKAFIAIVAANGDRPAKYQDFDTEAEAIAHKNQFGGFVAPNPGNAFAHWKVDMGAETLTQDQADMDAGLLVRSKMEKETLTHSELGRRAIIVHGQARSEAWLQRKASQFAWKKAKGILSVGDEAKAEALDSLGDSADILYDAIEAAADLATINVIDPADDLNW